MACCCCPAEVLGETWRVSGEKHVFCISWLRVMTDSDHAVLMSVLTLVFAVKWGVQGRDLVSIVCFQKLFMYSTHNSILYKNPFPLHLLAPTFAYSDKLTIRNPAVNSEATIHTQFVTDTIKPSVPSQLGKPIDFCVHHREWASVKKK